jgi:type VI secretion system secreted protein Hcp
MLNHHRSTTLLSTLVLALATVSFAAEQSFVKIEGTKQGIFKGVSKTNARLNWDPILSFGYEVATPTDPATGLNTGRTQYGMVSFAKEWGPSSPQLFQAIATNEILKSVVFEFSMINPNGEVEPYYRVTLSNARVVNYRQFLAMNDIHTLDSVSFAYQTILVESVTGKTSAIGETRGVAARSVGSAFGLSYSMTNGNFKVDLPDEEVELRFLDLNGALVKSLTARGGEVRFDARTLGVQPGMYLLKASVAGQPLGTVPVSIAK